MRLLTKRLIEKQLVLSLSVLCLLIPAGAFAQSIGIKFVGNGNPLNASDIAGFVPAANWNNESGGSGNATGLSDSTGAATLAGVTYNGLGTWAAGGNDAFPPGPNNVLMNGYLDGSDTVNAMVTVTNLPSSITNSGYSVYVYALGDTAGRGGDYVLTEGAASLTNQLFFASAPSTFINAATNGGTGDYVVFTGLSGSSFTVQGVPTVLVGVYRANINGLQIVPNGAPPAVGAVTPVGPNGFAFNITDVAGSTPNTNTLVVKLNGTTVINDGTNDSSGTISVTYSGGVTAVTYSQSANFVSGATNPVEVIFSGNFSGTVDVTQTFSVYYSNDAFAPSIGLQFGVDFYGLPLAPSDRAGVVPEYNWNPLAGAVNAGDTNITDSTGALVPVTVTWQANNVWGAGPGGNNGFPPGPNQFLMADYLDGGSGGVDAQVTVSGLPASFTSAGYSVYLYMLGDSPSPQGLYTVQDNNGYNSQLPANGLSGSSSFINASTVAGNHGNYLEFDGLTGNSIFVDATPAPGNNRSPLNAIQIVPNNTNAPSVSPAFPIGANGFSFNIRDAGSLAPDTNTLVVKLDGTAVAANTLAVSQSGIFTTVVYYQSGVFASSSSHTVEVSFTGNFTGSVDVTNSFTAPTYTALPIGLRTPPGSGDTNQPGFRWQVWQVSTNVVFANFGNGWQDQVQFDEQQIAGLFNTNTAAGVNGTNAADLTLFTDNGWYDDTNVINDSLGGHSFGAFTPANGYTNLPLAGLPGTEGLNNDVVYQVVTYLEFPTNGFFALGLQNDNGVKLTVGDRTGPDIGVRVLAPAGVAGLVDAVSQATTFGGPLPTTPIIARAVLCNPAYPSTLPSNAAALSKNIALIVRTGGSTMAHIRQAQNAGAVAAVFYDTTGATNELPTTVNSGSGNLTIPVLMIDKVEGANIYAHATADTNSPVVMSIGNDSSLDLGENGFGGKAYNVVVPQAGLYPFRVLFESDGVDAYIAWYATDVNGNSLLVNDLTGPFTTNTWAPAITLKAYRSRTVTTGPAMLNKPTVSGSNVMISWTGEGELEQAFSLTGPWTKSPYQNNPAAVPMNNLITTTFFRVRQY